MILRIKNKKGFSLLEVLMAVVILSFGLIGVLRAYGGSLVILEAGQSIIDTNNILRSKMGEMEQKILEDGKLTGASKGVLNGFQWEWDVNNVTTEGEGLYEIMLRASHPGNFRTLSLYTYYAEKKEE